MNPTFKLFTLFGALPLQASPLSKAPCFFFGPPRWGAHLRPIGGAQRVGVALATEGKWSLAAGWRVETPQRCSGWWGGLKRNLSSNKALWLLFSQGKGLQLTLQSCPQLPQAGELLPYLLYPLQPGSTPGPNATVVIEKVEAEAEGFEGRGSVHLPSGADFNLRLAVDEHDCEGFIRPCAGPEGTWPPEELSTRSSASTVGSFAPQDEVVRKEIRPRNVNPPSEFKLVCTFRSTPYTLYPHEGIYFHITRLKSTQEENATLFPLNNLESEALLRTLQIAFEQLVEVGRQLSLQAKETGKDFKAENSHQPRVELLLPQCMTEQGLRFPLIPRQSLVEAMQARAEGAVTLTASPAGVQINLPAEPVSSSMKIPLWSEILKWMVSSERNTRKELLGGQGGNLPMTFNSLSSVSCTVACGEGSADLECMQLTLSPRAMKRWRLFGVPLDIPRPQATPADKMEWEDGLKASLPSSASSPRLLMRNGWGELIPPSQLPNLSLTRRCGHATSLRRPTSIFFFCEDEVICPFCKAAWRLKSASQLQELSLYLEQFLKFKSTLSPEELASAYRFNRLELHRHLSENWESLQRDESLLEAAVEASEPLKLAEYREPDVERFELMHAKWKSARHCAKLLATAEKEFRKNQRLASEKSKETFAEAEKLITPTPAKAQTHVVLTPSLVQIQPRGVSLDCSEDKTSAQQNEIVPSSIEVESKLRFEEPTAEPTLYTSPQRESPKPAKLSSKKTWPWKPILLGGTALGLLTGLFIGYQRYRQNSPLQEELKPV